jgi:hypothetical protein
MRRTARRTLTTATVAALALGTAACGGEDATEADASPVATTEVDSGVAVDSVVGLEVTAVGNVSERLSDEAIRIDRDGLGNAEDQGEVGPDLGDYGYDYDYYEYDYLTEYDEDFDDADLADEGVLVVSASGLQSRKVDEAVRVSGTLRSFDQDVIESLYEINLEDDVFDAYENSLVLVADSVQSASAPAAKRGGGASSSPSRADS